MFTLWTSRSVLSIRPSPFKYIQIKQANTSTFCPSYITLGNLHRAKIRAPGHIFFDRGYRDTGIPSLEIFVPWMSSPYCPHDVDRTVDVMGSKPKPSKVSKENKHDDIKSFDFFSTFKSSHFDGFLTNVSFWKHTCQLWTFSGDVATPIYTMLPVYLGYIDQIKHRQLETSGCGVSKGYVIRSIRCTQDMKTICRY